MTAFGATRARKEEEEDNNNTDALQFLNELGRRLLETTGNV